ncbi:MAG: selenium cofactor biosynthesis protein YqeC [Halobacteriales archaeon]
MTLAGAIGVEGGVVSVVGAGGKKSTLYRLAAELERAVVTATVRIPIFDAHVARVAVTTEPTPVLDRVDPASWPLGLVPSREREDRYLGYDPAVVDRLADHPAVGTVLVKADGARMRKFKAPSEDEPRIPSTSTMVVPVASVHAIGAPLGDDVVHRVERVRAITGLERGDPITPEAVATVVASPEGGHKGVPAGATVVPLLNMVDDADLERVAMRAAAAILERCDAPRVVLSQLTSTNPVVDVVVRD